MSVADSVESAFEETPNIWRDVPYVYSIDKCYIQESDLCTLRKEIYRIIIKDKEFPSLDKLYEVAQALFGYCGTKKLLRKVLQFKLGFKFKICRNNGYIPIERRKFTRTRQNYLRDIISIRASPRDDVRIVYLDELDIHYHDVHNSVTASRSSIEKYLLMYAAKESGFIEGASKIIKYTLAIDSDEDHLDRIKTGLFMLWIQDILPKLPPNSIVVLDNAVPHNTWIEYIPNRLDEKRDMIYWLRQKNIKCNRRMSEAELYALVKKHRPANHFLVDALIEKAGHKAMRLPIYCDVNPLERLLTAVKKRVAENSEEGETDLTMIIADATKSITQEYWVEQFQHVKQLEIEYFQKEKKVNEVVDSLDVSVWHAEDDRSSSTFDYHTDFSSNEGDSAGHYETESHDSESDSESGVSDVVVEIM